MHPPGQFLATILSDEAARHLLHRHGGGDRAAAAIADRQLALVTTRQLNLAGLSARAIAGREARGLLTRLYQGVYLWGGAAPLPGARELGACLACGAAVHVSHHSAAVLWGLLPPTNDDVEVTGVARHFRSRAGLRVHRATRLDPADCADVRGIPVSAPARTLLDIAPGHGGELFERAVSDAFARRLLNERDVTAALARAGARPGVRIVRAYLDSLQCPQITRSRAERLLLKICRDAGLPRPRTNVRVGGRLVDAYWPEHNLIVETDGYAVHGHRSAFESDRARDQLLVAAGYRVMRVTWRQMTETPLAVAARLAAALARQ